MNPSRKLVSLAEAEALVRGAQKDGRSVVSCHGCFDIVHPGHVRHLQHAAKLGDHLLVSITGDAAIDKGSGRPLIPQELRAENLAALDCVAWVTINTDATAEEMLARIRPDVYVKGREYEHNRDPRFKAERAVVESAGGRVVFTSGDVVFSSSALIEAIEHTASPTQARLRQILEQHQLKAENVESIIASFRGRRVLVVGETITDTYVMCDRPEVAGESPVMTLRPIEYRSFDGGAAIIARHLAAMGARPILLTGLTRSPEAMALRERLATDGVETRWFELDHPIIEKQRFLVGSSKVMKLDLGQPITLDAARQRHVIHLAAAAAEECEAAIIADYGLGLFTSSMMHDLCTNVRKHVTFLAGDISGRRSNLRSLHGMDLICPSESEIRDALHDYDDGLSSVVWRVLSETKSKTAFVTLGADGLIAFGPPEGESMTWDGRLRAEHVPALAPTAVDQLGCGDSMLAAATLALNCGASMVIAAVLGSIAAAAQAQRLGNAVIGAAELRRGLRRICEAQLTWTPEPSALMVS